jgi:dephospho-CoA kinase
MRRLLIGLTGGIGAGKSTVACVLHELGAEIVSGDELGRKALDESVELRAQVQEKFGDGVFSSDGTLNRRALGKQVFTDREHARWLTDRTFPEIHRRWIQTAAASAREVVVFDAALILEWGIEREFDFVVVVTAPRDAIIRRLNQEGRLTAQEIESRLAVQISPDAKAACANIHLINDDTVETLERKVRELWQTRILPELNNKESERE